MRNYITISSTGTRPITTNIGRNKVTVNRRQTVQSAVNPIFSDSFETGNFNFEENGCGWSALANDAGVTTTNPRTGTYSLEYPYTDANSELRFQISGQPTEVWLEWWLYTPAAYATSWPGSGNHKFLRLWGGPSGYNSVNKLGFSTYPNGTIRCDRGLPGIVGHGPGTGGGLYTSSPTVTYTYTADAYTRFRVYAKMTTSVAANDARIVLWSNDTKIFDWNNLNQDFDSGGQYFDNGYFLGAKSPGWGTAVAQYIDDVKFYTTNPGWL